MSANLHHIPVHQISHIYSNVQYSNYVSSMLALATFWYHNNYIVVTDIFIHSISCMILLYSAALFCTEGVFSWGFTITDIFKICIVPLSTAGVGVDITIVLEDKLCKQESI